MDDKEVAALAMEFVRTAADLHAKRGGVHYGDWRTCRRERCTQQREVVRPFNHLLPEHVRV